MAMAMTTTAPAPAPADEQWAQVVMTMVREVGGTAFRDCRGEWHVWLPSEVDVDAAS